MAFILNYFLALTRVPNIVAHFLDGIDVSNFVLFMIIVLMYLLLGMVMDGLAMVVETLPIVMPLLEVMGRSEERRVGKDGRGGEGGGWLKRGERRKRQT